MLNEIKEKLPPKYTKIYPKNILFFCLKWPPCNVFSPSSPFTKNKILKANKMVTNGIRCWCTMGHKYLIFVFICILKFHKYLFGFFLLYGPIVHHNQWWQHVDLIIFIVLKELMALLKSPWMSQKYSFVKGTNSPSLLISWYNHQVKFDMLNLHLCTNVIIEYSIVCTFW
jgi:hypothetical protein